MSNPMNEINQSNLNESMSYIFNSNGIQLHVQEARYHAHQYARERRQICHRA